MAASTSPQTQTIAEKLSGFSYRESDALRLLTGEYRAVIAAHRVSSDHTAAVALRVSRRIFCDTVARQQPLIYLKKTTPHHARAR